MIHPTPSPVIFLRVLGILFVSFSWLIVLRPQMKVYWGRGANRPLMSQKSRLSFAVAMTGWCLGVFGANQKLALALFMIGFVVAVINAKEDEKEHTARTGVPARRTPQPQDYWLAFCLMDGVMLSIVTFALVRDHFIPPVNDEAKSVHAIGIVLFLLLSLGALILYLKRPDKV